jgi:dipeptidyl aminopeptidase/acylaminoacyl peptidase
MAPPLLGPELTQRLPAQAWSRLFPLAMANDLDYFRANDPFTLVEKNADALRDRTVIRLVCHWENEEWLYPQCEKLHELMVKLKLQHEFYFLMNVKGHNPVQCMNTMGDGALGFFSSSLARKAAPAAHPAAEKQPPTREPLVTLGEWETLADGSQGQATEFKAADGTAIAAYVRKPAGAGLFPIIVWMHGGKDSKDATLGTGRSQKSPVEDVVKHGWAVFAADFRHQEKIGIYPIEIDDTVSAVEAARSLPFVNPKRAGYLGQSHGAQIGTRVVSRADLAGAVLCAPAAMDFIQIKKVMKSGVKLVGVLDKILADQEKQYGATMEEIEKDPAKYHYASGITEATGTRCPILIVNGRDDDNSPTAVVEAYVRALTAAGKPVETYLPDHGPHGFYAGRPEIPETAESTRRIVAFFEKCFQEP